MKAPARVKVCKSYEDHKAKKNHLYTSFCTNKKRTIADNDTFS